MASNAAGSWGWAETCGNPVRQGGIALQALPVPDSRRSPPRYPRCRPGSGRSPGGGVARRRGSRRARPDAGSFDVRARQGLRGPASRNWSPTGEELEPRAGRPVDTQDGRQRAREVNARTARGRTAARCRGRQPAPRRPCQRMTTTVTPKSSAQSSQLRSVVKTGLDRLRPRARQTRSARLRFDLCR
jgi:hypothetical protein